MKKVLFCATVDSHFQKFHLPYLKWFKEQGWEVHVAAKGTLELPYIDFKHELGLERSPFRRANGQAYRELKGLMDTHNYDLVHCHTPMGGVLARLAARQARKRGTKVIYTAHGFHFCKGAPLANWLLYYPVEKLLSRYTDCLITINEEDYSLALKHRFGAGRVELVHGVGVDVREFAPLDGEVRLKRRTELGFRAKDFLLFYAAEFNKNKNQQMLIEALALAKDKAPETRLLLAGDGPLLEPCRQLADSLGVGSMVRFLGYRNDIRELLPLCDAAVSSSHREGLPVNIMEAMACGLPIVATENRGHRELVRNRVNGYIVHPGDSRMMADRFITLYRHADLRERMGQESVNQIQFFTLEKVSAELGKIYRTYMSGDTNEAENQYHRAYI